MSMDKQIASIRKSAFYHVNNIAKIRKFISFSTERPLLMHLSLKSLIIVIPFYRGFPKNQTQRLQYVQNSAARLLTGTSKHDNITSVLRQSLVAYGPEN